jgi:hypothetical protein
MLLEYGANIESQAYGACECAADNLWKPTEPEESVKPSRNRSAWTPLHLAMCSGREEIVRLLLSPGASLHVGGVAAMPGPDGLVSPPRINAYQSAAQLGSARLIEILNQTGVPVELIPSGNANNPSSSYRAAAVGTIRMVAAELLHHPGIYIKQTKTSVICSRIIPGRYAQGSVLELLCHQGRYYDAGWSVQYGLDQMYRLIFRDRALTFQRALAITCWLFLLAIPRHPSLRQRQNNLICSSSHHLTTIQRQALDAETAQSGLQGRLALASKLLRAGADPNAKVDVLVDPESRVPDSKRQLRK